MMYCKNGVESKIYSFVNYPGLPNFVNAFVENILFPRLMYHTKKLVINDNNNILLLLLLLLSIIVIIYQNDCSLCYISIVTVIC